MRKGVDVYPRLSFPTRETRDPWGFSYCSAMMTWERSIRAQVYWLSSSYLSHLFQIPVLSFYGWSWGYISLSLGLWDFQNGFFSLGICQLVYLWEELKWELCCHLNINSPISSFSENKRKQRKSYLVNQINNYKEFYCYL